MNGSTKKKVVSQRKPVSSRIKKSASGRKKKLVKKSRKGDAQLVIDGCRGKREGSSKVGLPSVIVNGT